MLASDQAIVCLLSSITLKCSCIHFDLMVPSRVSLRVKRVCFLSSITLQYSSPVRSDVSAVAVAFCATVGGLGARRCIGFVGEVVG